MHCCVLRRGGPGVVLRWSRGGPEVVCHLHWAIPICKTSSSHSNIEHYKTSRTCTETTLRIIKRTGASSQQCCKSHNEQELHHSNIASFKQIKHRKCVWHIHNCAKYLFLSWKLMAWTHSEFVQIETLAGAAPQQRSEFQNEQELYPSNTANYKTSRSCTTATLCHVKTNESCTTGTLWITKRTRASPRQDCDLQNEQELHHSDTTKHNTSESFTTATLWIKKEDRGWTHYQFARSGISFEHILNMCWLYLNTSSVLLLWDLPQTIWICIERF